MRQWPAIRPPHGERGCTGMPTTMQVGKRQSQHANDETWLERSGQSGQHWHVVADLRWRGGSCSCRGSRCRPRRTKQRRDRSGHISKRVPAVRRTWSPKKRRRFFSRCATARRQVRDGAQHDVETERRACELGYAWRGRGVTGSHSELAERMVTHGVIEAMGNCGRLAQGQGRLVRCCVQGSCAVQETLRGAQGA